MTLHEYLITHRVTAAAFGRMVGVPRSTAHRWRHGERIPRWSEMDRIERVTLGLVTYADFRLAYVPSRERRRRALDTPLP